jgi:hypothetical protein
MTIQDINNKIQEAKALLREVEELSALEYTSARHRPERREQFYKGVLIARDCHDSLELYRNALRGQCAEQNTQ